VRNWTLFVAVAGMCPVCVAAQDLAATLNKELADCRSGASYSACLLYADTLQHQAVAGGDPRVSDEAKCFQSRGLSLHQLTVKCADDQSSSDCSNLSRHLATDQSVDECQMPVNGAGVDIAVLTSAAPGCKGVLTVDAHNESWQSVVSLAPGQKGEFYVPLAPGPPGFQSWGVIDPGNRGQNTIVGNGVRAGDGFAAPGLPEGALLIKGGDGKIQTYDKPTGSVEISVPGSVAFLANDTQGTNDHHVFHIGFQGDGYADNFGTITVNWVKLPCPVPAHPQPAPHVPPAPQGDVRIVPSGSCNGAGNEMVLQNSTDHLITATIRRDISGNSGNITVPLAAHGSFPLGCTFGPDASQWSWNILSVQ
jgi:hypothetical protein